MPGCLKKKSLNTRDRNLCLGKLLYEIRKTHGYLSFRI